MKGRKPMPAALKALRGGTPSQVAGSVYPVDAPEMPEWLSHDAQLEWARVLPELVSLKLLAKVDQAALAAYCECYSSYRFAVIQLRDQGLMATGSMGQTRVNPLTGYIDSLLKQLRAYIEQFGFSPVSRARLAPPAQSDEEDEMERFMQGA